MTQETTLVTITFKVNADNYKEYERSLDNFLNSFVCYDVDTTEDLIDEDHPISIYTVHSVDDDGKHTNKYLVRENGDTCEIYTGDEVEYENLMEEKFSIEEDEILTYLMEDVNMYGETVRTIEKTFENQTTLVYDQDDYMR